MKIGHAVFIITSIVSIHGNVIPLNETECVEWHNYYRKIHQAPVMTWSASLARDAQAWANELASKNLWQHDSNTKQGENLYKISADFKNLCRRATTAFYKEEPLYNYDAAKYVSGAGHFTQVVWVNSKKVGVGKARAANGAILLVFRYTPPGNVIGSFKDNVKPKLKSGSNRVSAFRAIGLTITLMAMTQMSR